MAVAAAVIVVVIAAAVAVIVAVVVVVIALEVLVAAVDWKLKSRRQDKMSLLAKKKQEENWQQCKGRRIRQSLVRY
jgi:hypothetical protein